ncbi:MAG: glutamyl-tRNA reductase [Proteobacteria bacterium]|nr:glutamyl-tRNA reductase [Pseudomonadota bacterium]
MSEIYTVGVSYHNAPLALREILAVSAEGVAEKLRHLSRRCHLPEAAILSTCNRTEIYCLSDTPEEVVAWLSEATHNHTADISEYIYHLKAEDAVRHLFRVASGLDSQLIGEPEITGQVKQFAQLARQAGFSGTIINRLMEHALATAKAVRSQTDIGKHSLSYPALVVQAAKGIFPDVRDLAVLFVGAGDMALAGVPIFSDNGVRRVAIAGRSHEKTEKVAQRVGAEALAISCLPEVLAEFDVVVSATASQVPIIGKGTVESALSRRHHKPMLFADLAVPRDLESEIQQLPDVFVYHLDQFGKMAEQNSEKRRTAAKRGNAIVEEHTEQFCRWLREHGNRGQVRGFRDSAMHIQAEETKAALARLTAGVAPEQVVEQFAHRLTGRLLHPLTQCARQSKNCTLHHFAEGHRPITFENDQINAPVNTKKIN